MATQNTKTPRRGQVVALVAPTGAGKTQTLFALAQKLNFEVISADSVQAVRGFDIGSAKPTSKEQARLTHHLVDVVDPTERYDAKRFADDARAIIDAQPQRKFVITAGTGLYLAALTEGLQALPNLPEAERDALADQVQADPHCAHQQLAELDPTAAAELHPNDWRRIARALEIARASGQPPTVVRQGADTHPSMSIPMFGIWGQGAAYEQGLIDRTKAMLDQGWVEEVQQLITDHGDALPALGAVGYRQIVEHLNDPQPLEQLAEHIYRATRGYAKRQRTWFKRRPVAWFPYTGNTVHQPLVDALLDVLG